MLYASKEELQSDTRVRLLAIKYRELEWLMDSCRYVAQLSALISGYGYTALLYTKYIDNQLCDPNEPLCAEMTYPLCVTITFCLSIFSLFATMVITLLAPAIALRGPQGSVSRCVDVAIQEYQYALVLFGGSVFMLLVSTGIWSLTTHNLLAVGIIFVVLVGSGILIALTSRKALRRFDAPRSFNAPDAPRFVHASTPLGGHGAGAVLPSRPPHQSAVNGSAAGAMCSTTACGDLLGHDAGPWGGVASPAAASRGNGGVSDSGGCGLRSGEGAETEEPRVATTRLPPPRLRRPPPSQQPQGTPECPAGASGGGSMATQAEPGRRPDRRAGSPPTQIQEPQHAQPQQQHEVEHVQQQQQRPSTAAAGGRRVNFCCGDSGGGAAAGAAPPLL